MKIIRIYVEGSPGEYSRDNAIVIPGESGADNKRRAVLKDLYLLDYLCDNEDVLYHDLDCEINSGIENYIKCIDNRPAAGKTGNVFDTFLVYSNNKKFWHTCRAEYMKFEYAKHGPVYGFLSKIIRFKGMNEIPKEYYTHIGRLYG